MDDTPVDEMNYEKLAQDALRGVIRSALMRIQKDGPPGAHHFYITIMTTAPGVRIPGDILARYPGEMTIVLQHQFWELEVWEDRFDVQLTFGGMPKRLIIPFSAVSRFYDPSVQFLLQFDAPAPAEESVLNITSDAASSAPAEQPDNVVTLFKPGKIRAD